MKKVTTCVHILAPLINNCILVFVQSPMTNLYKKMFPVVLQLACDVERVN